MCSLADIKNVITQASDILIVAHIQPDGDTLGACFALKEALCSIGKTAEVCCENPIPHRYAELFSGQTLHRLQDIKRQYALVIAVDCADKSRLGKAVKIFDQAAKTVNIDHHVTNDGFAKMNYIAEASSAGEIIYELTVTLGAALTTDAAKFLYIAISTDTGNFTYSNTSKKALCYAAEVVERFDLCYVADILFRQRTLVLTQLIGRALSRLEIFAGGKIACVTLLLSDMNEFGATGADCENIVDFAREIEDTRVAVFFRQLDHGVKISFRSKGSYDVCAVAVQYGGGGHVNASGACASGSLEDVKKEVIEKLLEIV